MGTTPIYGFPYPDPSDLVANYPALGQDLAEDIEAVLPTLGGLAPITPTSIANSGGSASLSGNTVTMTGTTTVSLNGVFSATYQNYRLLINSTSSLAGTIVSRLRVAGVDASGTNYFSQRALFFSTTSSPARFTSETFARVGGGDTNVGPNLATLDLANPFLTTYTVFLTQNFDNGDSNNAQLALYGATHKLNTSYDGITIYNPSGTMTGQIRVYGYKGA